MSSSPTETASARCSSRCPRWASRSPRARSSMWRKQAGDWVERDETVCEVTTDKIDAEIPSPAAGRVARADRRRARDRRRRHAARRIATDAAPGRGRTPTSTVSDAPGGRRSPARDGAAPAARRRWPARRPRPRHRLPRRPPGTAGRRAPIAGRQQDRDRTASTAAHGTGPPTGAAAPPSRTCSRTGRRTRAEPAAPGSPAQERTAAGRPAKRRPSVAGPGGAAASRCRGCAARSPST